MKREAKQAAEDGKKLRIRCGITAAATARNSGGVMKLKRDRRLKDARRHWSRDGGD